MILKMQKSGNPPKIRGLSFKISKLKKNFYAALTEIEKFEQTSKLTANATPCYLKIVQQVKTNVRHVQPIQFSVKSLFFCSLHYRLT